MKGSEKTIVYYLEKIQKKQDLHRFDKVLEILLDRQSDKKYRKLQAREFAELERLFKEKGTPVEKRAMVGVLLSLSYSEGLPGLCSMDEVKARQIVKEVSALDWYRIKKERVEKDHLHPYVRLCEILSSENSRGRMALLSEFKKECSDFFWTSYFHGCFYQKASETAFKNENNEEGQRQLESAVTEFNEAIDKRGEDAGKLSGHKARFHRAKYRLALCFITEAQRSERESRTAESNSRERESDNYYTQAQRYYRTASDLLKGAIKDNPEFLQAKRALAQVYVIRDKNPERVKKRIEELLAECMDDGEMLSICAKALWDKGYHKESDDLFKRYFHALEGLSRVAYLETSNDDTRNSFSMDRLLADSNEVKGEDVTKDDEKHAHSQVLVDYANMLVEWQNTVDTSNAQVLRRSQSRLGFRKGIYDTRKRREEAAYLYRLAVDESPKNADAWFGLSNSLKYFHRTDDACRALCQAYKLDPEDCEIGLKYAESLLQSNDSTMAVGVLLGLVHDARRDVERIVEEFEDTISALFLRLWLYYEEHNDSAFDKVLRSLSTESHLANFICLLHDQTFLNLRLPVAFMLKALEGVDNYLKKLKNSDKRLFKSESVKIVKAQVAYLRFAIEYTHPRGRDVEVCEKRFNSIDFGVLKKGSNCFPPLWAKICLQFLETLNTPHRYFDKEKFLLQHIGNFEAFASAEADFVAKWKNSIKAEEKRLADALARTNCLLDLSFDDDELSSEDKTVCVV